MPVHIYLLHFSVIFTPFPSPLFFLLLDLWYCFFLLLTAFLTNMVRCYIRTPLKLTFLNSVTFFLLFFSLLSMLRPYNHILTWTSAICKREHIWRGQPKLIWFKKINIENKNIIVGIYERTCILYSFLIIQRTQDNLHVRLVQVVLKEASQDGTQRSLKISIACSTNGILKNETVTKISFFLTILF